MGISGSEIFGSVEVDKKDLMKKVFELASRGEGNVSPNPMVGALLVKNGRVIAEGYHRYFGGDHAEIDAIKNAKEDVVGSTLFCNLEPCCHEDKKTPPCTETLIKHKIAKVIFSNLDPNPEVAGKGAEILKFNGIEIETGLLREDGHQLNEAYFKYITTGKPFIHIKMAQSIDGKLCTEQGESKWISGDLSRRRVHQLRAKYDAVLVGRETLNKDNPKLTSRLPFHDKNNQPRRVVIGNPKFMNASAYIFNDEFREQTIIVSTIKKSRFDYKMESVFDGIDVIELCDFRDEDIWNELADRLGTMGISSILVEGGAYTINSLMSSEQWDKITTFISPKFIGNGSPYYHSKESALAQAVPLKWSHIETFGRDACMEGYRY